MNTLLIKIKHLIYSDSNKGKIFSNTIYQIVGKCISMSITILATILITRSYGVSGYGDFSLMQSWPAFLFIIVDFGINAIATRELSKDWSKASKYFGNILLIRVSLSLFFIFILSIVIGFMPYSDNLSYGLRFSIFLILTQALFATTNIFFQVKLRYDLSNIGYVTGYIFILGLIYFLTKNNYNVVWVNFSYVVGGIITFLLNYYFVRYKLGVIPDFRIDKELWKYLFISALPLGLMFIFSQISFKEDAIMISLLNLPKSYGLTNVESVGVYSLPYKVFEVSMVIPAFFMNAAYPILVRKMQEGKEELKSAFKKSILFLMISGFTVGLFGCLFSSSIVSFLGGSDFNQSILVLNILMIGIVLFYLTQPISWLIVTLGYQRKLPMIYAISAVFNLVANFIFIPKYSFYAAAIITQISELIILILLTKAAIDSWKLKYEAI